MRVDDKKIYRLWTYGTPGGRVVGYVITDGSSPYDVRSHKESYGICFDTVCVPITKGEIELLMRLVPYCVADWTENN